MPSACGVQHCWASGGHASGHRPSGRMPRGSQSYHAGWRQGCRTVGVQGAMSCAMHVAHRVYACARQRRPERRRQCSFGHRPVRRPVRRPERRQARRHERRQEPGPERRPGRRPERRQERRPERGPERSARRRVVAEASCLRGPALVTLAIVVAGGRRGGLLQNIRLYLHWRSLLVWTR